MADLVVQYGDLPAGTTDAAVSSLAERLAVAEIATPDWRPSRGTTPARSALVLLT